MESSVFETSEALKTSEPGKPVLPGTDPAKLELSARFGRPRGADSSTFGGDLVANLDQQLKCEVGCGRGERPDRQHDETYPMRAG